MKFDVIERDVTSSGAIKTKDITLSANAKAFKIIFGQIYPDIIKAIVRELFTNAWDSQKMAGTLSTPIDIHLPSAFEPWFSIRDYGLGMTPEIIDDVYSKVFESTKDASNDEAGMFGMGSKTPLGYTDGFTVTSYVDGTLYAYDIFIGSNGNPQISLNACEETTEPNGVEVSVAVKKEDFDKFKDNAELFALHAGTPININRTRFLNTRSIILLSGENWTLYEKSELFDDKLFIRMGCVLYKLDVDLYIDNLPGYASYSELQEIRRVFSLPLILDFDIGDFDVTSSREDIIYNHGAASKIKERLKIASSEIAEQVKERVNNTSSFRESYYYASQFNDLRIINTDDYRRMRYGAMSILRAERYARGIMKHYDIAHAIFKRDPFKPIGFAKSLDLFLFMNRHVTTYIVLDDGKTKRALARIQNLTQKIHQKARLIKKDVTAYNACSTYMWIRGENPAAALKRLHTFAPTKYFIINIADIEPLKSTRAPRVKREPVDSAFRLRYRNKFGRIAVSLTHDEMGENLYYVMLSEGKNFVESNKNIKEALDILGVGTDQVCAIPKKREHYIAKYNLIDLIEEAKNSKESISYNDDTYYWHAIQGLRLVCDFNRKYGHWLNNWNIPEIARVIGHAIVEDDVDKNFFVKNVNEKVEKRYEEVYNSIQNNIIEFYKKYPILEFVNNYQFSTRTTEIFKIIGESE